MSLVSVLTFWLGEGLAERIVSSGRDRLALLNEVVFQSDCHHFDPAFSSQLAENVGQVELDGRHADRELVGDIGVG